MSSTSDIVALRSRLDETRGLDTGRRDLLRRLGRSLLYCTNYATQSRDIQGGVYVPQSVEEEAALVLLLCGVLHPKELRTDTVLFWNMCMAACTASQWSALSAALPKAQVSSWTNPKEWMATALADLSSGAPARARLSLRALIGDRPEDAAALMLASQACIRSGGQHCKEALQYARRARTVLEASGSPLSPRCLLLEGVAAFTAASKTLVSDSERSSLLKEALDSLTAAVEQDPQDAHMLYNLGVVQASARDLPAAVRSARGAIASSGGAHGLSWVLLSVVLGAQHRKGSALTVASAAMKELGANTPHLVMVVRCRLQLHEGDVKGALESLSYVMAALQQDASQQGDTQQRKQQEVQVWCELARVFLIAQQFADTRYCLEAAAALDPWSPPLVVLQAALAQAEGRTEDAIGLYNTCRSINIGFSKSSISLGAIYLEKGSDYDLATAEMYLKSAMQYEPDRAEGWYRLGCVYKKQQRMEAAESALRKAVGLAISAPVYRFNQLPLAV